MTTLTDRPHTALVVIDVQDGIFATVHERDAVVTKIASLVDRARDSSVPVVWVQHSSDELKYGSDAWKIVPELSPRQEEPHIHKKFGDSFEGTDLEVVLAGLGVGRLVVTGAATDWCVRSTLHGAFVRGYDATLVSDAHTTQDMSGWGAPTPDKVIAHTNIYWSQQAAPGRTAGAVPAADVTF